MGKLPAIQFYPGDWRKDPGVQSLGFFERGIWFEILLIMHESDERGVLLLNGKPMSEKALGQLLGLDNQNLTSALTTILEHGVASRREDGALINRRMVRDQEIRHIRSEAGKLGGNPNLVKQKPTTKVKQIPTPSSSSSSSSSSSDLGGEKTPTKEPKIKFTERISLTQSEYDKLGETFTLPVITYYLPILSDWLANGKAKRDHAAFIRNWIRKDQTEKKGFYAAATGNGHFLSVRERTLEREAEAVRISGLLVSDYNSRHPKPLAITSGEKK